MDKFTFLNDQEKSFVEAFYKNEVQREAVKKVLLMGIYEEGVVKAGVKHSGNENWVYSLPWKQDANNPVSNEQLGAEVRAIAEAIKFVEVAFVHKLPKFVRQEESKPKKNPGK